MTGAGVSTLLVPIVLAVIFGVVGLLYALLAAPTDDDRAAAAYLDARRVPNRQPRRPPLPGSGRAARRSTSASRAPVPVPPGHAAALTPYDRPASAVRARRGSGWWAGRPAAVDGEGDQQPGWSVAPCMGTDLRQQILMSVVARTCWSLPSSIRR
ncbi:hypothetical protein NKG94_08370 [Micromonospora sp. M12]